MSIAVLLRARGRARFIMSKTASNGQYNSFYFTIGRAEDGPGCRNVAQGGAMARLVKRFRNQPYAVAIAGETQYICGCGLSATAPFCDGTHKITRTEAPGKVYWYDGDERRHEAADVYPDI